MKIRRFPKSRAAGFTLVEMAFSLFIIGLLLSSSLVMAQFVKAERTRETREKIDNIATILSTYAQTHYRLPCPADPNAGPAEQGKEVADGDCLDTTTTATMYSSTEGIVPWKELGIPQHMVMDAWNRYITYKPAPNLTVDTLSATAQDTHNPLLEKGATLQDVHDACRTSMWFNSDGEHVNRAKALFCCNAAPKTAYLDDKGKNNAPAANEDWRKQGVLETSAAAAVTPSASGTLPDTAEAIITGNWSARTTDVDSNGDFSSSIHMKDIAGKSLLQATGPAVTLISHGGNGRLAFLPRESKSARMGATVTGAGVTAPLTSDIERKNAWPPQMFAAIIGHPKTNDGDINELSPRDGAASDDISMVLRTDQLFAKAGNGSCLTPPSTFFQPYTCTQQEFINPVTGGIGTGSNNFGLQLNLEGGKKFELSTTFVKHENEAGFRNTLGFYIINSDGTIGDVKIITDNVNDPDLEPGTPQTTPLGISPETSEFGMGIFIVPNGFSLNNGYNNQDFSTLKFVNPNNPAAPANVNDGVPPRLVFENPDTLTQTVVQSNDSPGTAYHYNNLLNPGQVNRTLRDDHICQNTGQMVGPEHPDLPGGESKNVRCPRRTSVQDSGVSDDEKTLNVGFEDLPFDSSASSCYQMKDGSCRPANQAPIADRLTDNEKGNGFLAKMGDSDFDDVTFSFQMVTCPITTN